MKIVRESKSKRFRIPPPPMKIVRESKSERLRIPGRSMWRLICNPRDTTRSYSTYHNVQKIRNCTSILLSYLPRIISSHLPEGRSSGQLPDSSNCGKLNILFPSTFANKYITSGRKIILLFYPVGSHRSIVSTYSAVSSHLLTGSSTFSAVSCQLSRKITARVS